MPLLSTGGRQNQLNMEVLYRGFKDFILHPENQRSSPWKKRKTCKIDGLPQIHGSSCLVRSPVAFSATEMHY